MDLKGKQRALLLKYSEETRQANVTINKMKDLLMADIESRYSTEMKALKSD